MTTDTAETQIDTLIMDGREPEAIVMLRTGKGLEIARYNTASSALLHFHRRNPLSNRQLAAGIRYEADHLMGSVGASNAATIFDHLQRSIKATASDDVAKAFGHVMRVNETRGGSGKSLAETKMLAAHRRAWVERYLSPVGKRMLELFILQDLPVSIVAQRLDMDRNYVAGRVREALSELAKGYQLYSDADGYSGVHPEFTTKGENGA